LTNQDDQRLRELVARLAVAPTDEQAWSELYRQMRPFVFGIVYRRLRGVSGPAEDLTQEVFIKLFRARPFARLQEDSNSFRAYLARIAQNTTSTYLRQVMRTQNLEKNLQFHNEITSQISESETSYSSIEYKDTVQGLKKELRPAEKDLLGLVLSGSSISDIAKALGTTYAAAAVRLYRLRKRLSST
jgi:RNA polymerase sigma factor (sigma-70 family)